MIAVIDGLAVQKLLDPDSVRLDVVVPFWEDMLRLVFERRDSPRPAGRDRPSPPSHLIGPRSAQRR
jgi:hypothetical protein